MFTKDLHIIAIRLRQARNKAGLSQRILGIMAGIDEFSASPRMNQYERGKHIPDIYMVERLAKVLGVPETFFYCKNDVMAALILAADQLDDDAKAKLLASIKTPDWR